MNDLSHAPGYGRMGGENKGWRAIRRTLGRDFFAPRP
jgi:hypothetical protein